MFAGQCFAQKNEEVVSEAQVMLQETAQATQQEKPSSTVVSEDAYSDGSTPQQRFEENPKHNVHEYDYKQQVIVGGVVMFCVALAMIASNNYNPKRGN
jgi:hypothetical protein